MSLLGSVLGAVLGGGQQQQGAQGEQSGLGSLIGMVANNPQIISVVAGMLSNDGQNGGLGGLVSKFQQAGQGDAINSWIGSGENQAISPTDIGNVLGNDTLGKIAGQLGMGNGDASNILAQVLPGIINQMTPQGQAPAGGLGNAGDIIGMLGGMLGNRS
jgi:uncharacterized protein YidB (DUF937 family)